MKIVTLIFIALLQLVGLLFPFDTQYYTQPLFIFTFIPIVIIMLFSLIKQQQWMFYVILLTISIKILLYILIGFELSLIESIFGGIFVLLYINIVNSYEDLKLKIKKLRPLLLKLLDFFLFIGIFTILVIFLVIPMAESNFIQLTGINEVWVLIISIVIFILLIVFINAILSIKSVD